MATQGIYTARLTIHEVEEMVTFLNKFGGLIPLVATDIPYLSKTYEVSQKSKADNGLMSISFGLECWALRARIGAHCELSTVPSKNGADAMPSWAHTLKVQESPDRCGKTCYFQRTRIRGA